MIQYDPFPHIIKDNYLPPGLVLAVEATWPRLDWPEWHRYDTGDSQKLATRHHSTITPAARLVLAELAKLNVGELFGHYDAFPDLECHGAGMHCIPSGGSLGLHLDAESHPLRPWRRLVSVILFCGKWKSGWSGDLVLGNKKIQPKFNRLVAFECTTDAWHGVPEPVQCPKNECRKSVALFFWSSNMSRSGATQAQFIQK